MCEDIMWDELIESVDVLRAEARNAQRVAAEVKRLKKTNALLLNALEAVMVESTPQQPMWTDAWYAAMEQADKAVAAAEGAG